MLTKVTIRKKSKTLKQRCSFTGRSYQHYNKDIFQDHVLNADWIKFNVCQSQIHKWEMIKIILRKSLLICTIKIFRTNQIKHLWVTAPLIELIKDEDIALNNGKKKKR